MLDDLRADLRRQMPPLKSGGLVYSDNPSQRMVVLDKQVYREGEAMSADLSVDQIRPNGVVLNWRGTRYLLPM